MSEMKKVVTDIHAFSERHSLAVEIVAFLDANGGGATVETTLTGTMYKIVELLIDNSRILIQSICGVFDLSRDGVNYQIRVLKAKARLPHVGGRKEGVWEMKSDFMWRK